ncbi:hypothetical protein [Paenibacillus sp. TY11]|uniref:hypothetical protein n=1 Tax=Paenibacillus sp. TY11 TaxID=3448633 RepID=UPI00403A52ED
MKNGVDKGCETMGIWHEALLGKLSRPKLLEQRCECGALRGDGWGKPYATVNVYWMLNHGGGSLADE